jgi:adenylosuccinate lyase
VVKHEGKSNDLLERLAADPAFSGVNLDSAFDPRQYVGRAPEQVDEFLHDVIAPMRERYRDQLGASAELRV